MTLNAALYAGFVVGLSIAAPVGPMSLLCIQRTLAFGMRVGLSTGLGAATMNVLYASLMLAGMDAIAPWLASAQRGLGIAGGLFLLWAALRTIRRSGAAAGKAEMAAPSVVGAYGSAILFNATNPLSPILILACLSPILAVQAPSPSGSVALLAGLFAAAAGWWVCLTGTVSLLRTHLSPGVLRGVNWAAGAVLTIYGGLALERSLGR